MTFVELNSDFVQNVYNKIELDLINSCRKTKQLKNLKVFTYDGYMSHAFRMPETPRFSTCQRFHKRYDQHLTIEPLAQMRDKVLLVAYCPEIATQKAQVNALSIKYRRHRLAMLNRPKKRVVKKNGETK